MKKIVTFIFLGFLSFSCFAKESRGAGITILSNPFYSVYDIVSVFMDNRADTFQIITDLEVQVPIQKNVGLSVYQKLSFDSYYESYSMNSLGVQNYNKALQTEYRVEPGLNFILSNEGQIKSAPFLTLFPIIGFVDVHSQQSWNDFLLLGAGVLGGYQWKFDSGFTLKLYAGISKAGEVALVNSPSCSYKVSYTNLFGLPFELRIGCRIGLNL